MWENKVRTELTNMFLAALREDQIPWQKCWRVSRPMSFSTGKPYRGINNLLLSYISAEKGYADPRWITYKQAQDHDWQVRLGEKSARVEYWQYYDTKLKKGLTRAEVAQIQHDEPERMQDIRLAAYTYNVFNAEQVDGMPPLEKGPELSPAFGLSQRDTFLENLGVGFREGGSRAYYTVKTDIITLPCVQHFTSEYGYICTLLHEAGHATGHPDRLNRPSLGHAMHGSPEYAMEELRAEIASAFTAQALHLTYQPDDLTEGLRQHKAYIQDWIDVLENDPNQLFAAIKDADKITDYLLEHGKLLELDRPGEELSGPQSEPAPQEEPEPEL